MSAASLARRLRKLEARRKPAELRVRHVWWDAGEPEPVAQPGERLVICSWDDHPEPAARRRSRAGERRRVSLALRRRLARLERADGEPMFGDGDPEQLRELAGLVGAVVGRDLAGLPAAALPRALDRAIKRSSDAELAPMIEAVREAAPTASS